MLTEKFKPHEDESDEEFRSRVQKFAKAVTTMAVHFMNGADGKATSGEVLYFP